MLHDETHRSDAPNSGAANSTLDRSSDATSVAPSAAETPAAADPKVLKSMEETLALQERMISALEADNKRLVVENKKLRDSAKQYAQNSGRFDPSPPSVAPAHNANISQTDVRPSSIPPWSAAKAHQDTASPATVPKSFMDAEIKRLTTSHEQELQDMARKVAWYVDNQEFNRAQDALISEQQSTIHELRARVMELESLTGHSVGRPIKTDKDKQIAVLQRRIVELEESLKGQNPHSITELIRACRPPVQEQRAYKHLEEQLREARTQLAESERNAQVTINRLRVDADALRTQYAARLERLQEDLGKRLVDTQTRKVRELEKKLTETRKAYSARITELERANLALRRGVAPSPVPSSRPLKPRSRVDTQGGESVEVIEGGLNRSRSSSPPAEVTSRQASDSVENSIDGRTKRHGTTDDGSSNVMSSAVVKRLEQENGELRCNVMSLQNEIQRLSRAPPAVLGDMTSGLQFQVNQLQSEIQLYQRLLREAQDSLRNAHAQHEERIYALRCEHQRVEEQTRRDCESQIADVQARHKAEIESLQRNASSHSGQLRELLSTRTETLSRRDARQYLVAVAERLDAIERQESLRAMEYQRVLEDARRLAETEIAIERQKMELEIRRKNQEIVEFQIQLDGLLSEVASLSLAQPKVSSTISCRAT